MADTSIRGSCWISIPSGVNTIKMNQVLSCTRTDISSYKVLSLDIECIGTDGKFPISSQDSIIMIGMVIYEQNTTTGELDLIDMIVLLIGNCEKSFINFPKAKCFEFKCVYEMLVKFFEIISIYDPNIMTGYNIIQFYIPYIIERCIKLKCDNVVFPNLSRTSSNNLKFRKSIINGAYRSCKKYFINIPGRIIFDMYTFSRKEFKLSSYKLDDVSFQILKDKKIDVHHSEIKKLFDTESGRREVAEYCIKDADLPVRIANKTKSFISYIEFFRSMCVTFQNTIDKELQYKIYSNILYDIILYIISISHLYIHQP